MYQQPFHNPYLQGNYSQPIQLQPQQVTQVNGRASAEAIRMAPNSSVLVMDNTAPVVYLCMSDGIGTVSVQAYDIVLHKDKPPIDVESIESRLTMIENTIADMEGKINAKSNVSRTKSKSGIADDTED